MFNSKLYTLRDEDFALSEWIRFISFKAAWCAGEPYVLVLSESGNLHLIDTANKDILSSIRGGFYTYTNGVHSFRSKETWLCNNKRNIITPFSVDYIQGTGK